MKRKIEYRPRDLNRLSKTIVEIATGDQENKLTELKNPHAVALGQLGGKKGGEARALSLTPERRQEIARIAAEARWSYKKKE